MKSAFKELQSILEDKKSPFYYDSLQTIKVRFHITTPDIKKIEQLYEQDDIKSHEFVAILETLTERVKNAITIAVNTMNYTVNQYIPFKNSITITRTERFQKKHGVKSKRIDSVKLTFNTRKITMKEMFAFLEWCTLDEYAFSKKILFEVDGLKKNESEIQEIIQLQVEKKPLSEVTHFLSIHDFEKTNELLGHPHFFQALKNYMFLEGFEAQAEITLDVAKEEIFPQKRRTVSIDNTSMKFHQLITTETPLEIYQKILYENQIAGFYCSVKSANDNLLYLLIDIDVPSLLYKIFPAQKVWELTINIAKSINKTCVQFGLPSFKVSFSGAKGLHLISVLENPLVIEDLEQYVNIPELYTFLQLPGMRTLKQEKISSLNDKFKFAKSLLQALLLYTVYQGDIEIPMEIRYKLKISRPYQLFRLSPDSKNRLAILLDCSSMSRGVFRLFSPHPASKLVSIPISNKSKICERYLEYNNVREDAKIDSVIQRFNENKVDLFLQRPNTITRQHIKELLRPDRLLPTFAILLRFGTIYSIMRSPQSFAFWYRFYQQKIFYGYVETMVEYYDREDLNNFLSYITNMASRLHIHNKEGVIIAIQLYLLYKKISLPLFKYKLSTLYYIEFFFTLKPNIFLIEHEEDLLELFKEHMSFNSFLQQAQEIFNIAVNNIFSHVIFEEDTELSQGQTEYINYFYKKILSFIDITRTHLSELRHMPEARDKEGQLITSIYFFNKLFFLSIEFIRNFYNFNEKSKVIDIWR
ncbi:MAG: hypothetical protein ACFFB8_12610 [Promethearchaeota archaeon]